jgi:hypothetical protein
MAAKLVKKFRTVNKVGIRQIILVVTAFVLSTSVNAESITIWSSDNGSYASNGNHDPDSNNILTGQTKSYGGDPGIELRNFLYFDLSSISGYTVTSAVVTYVAGNGTTGDSGYGNEIVDLYDVTSEISNLLSGGGVSVFTDLGTGNSYGSAVVEVSTGLAPMPEVSFNLNTAALTDLNLLLSGAGTDFAIGAAFSSFDGNIFEVLWWGSDLESAASLTLEVNAIPIPAAAWLFGSGFLGLIGVARRRKNA